MRPERPTPPPKAPNHVHLAGRGLALEIGPGLPLEIGRIDADLIDLSPHDPLTISKRSSYRVEIRAAKPAA